MLYGNDDIFESGMKVVIVQVLGVLLSISSIFANWVVVCLLSLPFWLIWSVFGIGSKYFYFLPQIYHRIPLWHCLCLFLCIEVVRNLFVRTLTNINGKIN